MRQCCLDLVCLLGAMLCAVGAGLMLWARRDDEVDEE